MRMIDPPPPAIIQGKTARLKRKEPVRLTASTRSHSARLVSRTVPPASYGAAPLTRMSSRPKVSRAARVTMFASASIAASQVLAIARPPVSWTRRAVSSTEARSMSQQATAVPASANASVMARPMPLPAPLTSATFAVRAAMCSRFASQHNRRDGLARYHTTRVRDEPNHCADKIGRRQVALDRLPALYHLKRALDSLAKELARAVGQHRAWRQRVDADPIASELAGQPAGQSDHRRFRGRVVQRKRRAVGRGKRGKVDDA